MASFEQRTPRCLPPGRTRRSPPEHCRVAKVYGLETTAMRDGGYNPPHTYSSKHYGRPRSDDDYAPTPLDAHCPLIMRTSRQLLRVGLLLRSAQAWRVGPHRACGGGMARVRNT